MNVGLVEGIRMVGPAEARRAVTDVMPAVGVEGAGRMEEDSYDGKNEGEERGLDEDSDEVNEEAQQGEGPEVLQESAKKLNFFA